MSMEELEQLNFAFQRWMNSISWQEMMWFWLIGSLIIGSTYTWFLVRKARRNGTLPRKPTSLS